MQEGNGGVIVTGGAQGIGRAIAQRLLDEGHRVAIFDNDAEAGEETLAEIDAGDRLAFHHVDVSDEEQCASAVAEIREVLGGVQGLVNNAGIMISKPLERLSLSEWNKVLAVNLTAAFLTTRAATGALRESRGAIVNIASTRARMSEADTEAYAASKGGLVALTHALAISLGPDIRVNCISPGWIDVTSWKKRSRRKQEPLEPEDHAQHPAGRVGRPGDVAAMAAFLLGPKAEFVTGADFTVDGGMTRKMIYI